MSNSSLVSGLSEASGVKLSWVKVSQESLQIMKTNRGNGPIEGPLKGLVVGGERASLEHDATMKAHFVSHASPATLSLCAARFKAQAALARWHAEDSERAPDARAVPPVLDKKKAFNGPSTGRLFRCFVVFRLSGRLRPMRILL